MIQTSKTRAGRDPALDIIRICAFLFVVSVHFFLKCGYYDVCVSGRAMYLATFLRQFLMICVPLFMMLTGYLTGDRKPCRNYYRKLVDTLGVYILASLCCTAYKLYTGYETFWSYRLVNDITSYAAAPYSWYVEMYIGLFLLCPFLNAGWKALEGKRGKQQLLVVLLILTAVPRAVNVFRPWLSWFRAPASSDDYLQLLPDYWVGLYPFLYYFLGCYIREYGLAVRPCKALILSVAMAVFQGFFNIWRSMGNPFIWGAWQSHGSLFVVIQTVLFFGLILNLNLSKLPSWLCKVLSRLSGLCFGAYLVSYIFDDIFYTRLNAAIDYVPYRFPWFFVSVPLIFISSLALSFLVNQCYMLLKKGTVVVWMLTRGKTTIKK